MKDLSSKETPTEQDFQQHFEKLLNDPTMPLEVPLEIESCPYIPTTDDPISPGEVLMAMDNIKPNKSAGPSGIPPGVLKALPNKWIVFFATLFTIIF